MIVIKRDGREVIFDKKKIFSAVEKAFDDVYNYDYNKKQIYKIVDVIIENIDFNSESISIEEIQNTVENVLMKYNSEVAKSYILYREKRSQIRQSKTKLMKEVETKLFAVDVQNQNANVDEKSFGGRVGEVSNAVLNDYALNHCMSKTARENHLNNEIYTHDLGSYAVGTHNCLSIPFDDLLRDGFNTRQTDVRPAGSVNTAFQLTAVIFQLQSLQQFG